ncbi:MAG: Sip1-related alpha-galactosidase [Clostridia bacterium]|nr:Sip1-related alpha-galactosidase [Clostridia bacterium]
MINYIKDFEFELSVELKDFRGNVFEGTIIEEKENYCKFAVLSEQKEKGYCVFRILKNGDTVCFEVDANLTKGASYDIRKTFFPFDSIKLYISPKEKADAAMGSFYFIPEKSDCWAKEFFCEDIVDAPKRIASLLWKKNNTYFHMMPLCDGDFKSEIHGNGNELEVTISPYTGGFREISGKAIVMAWGKNPYKLMGKTIEAGFSYLGLARSMTKDKKLPEMFEYLGWCSWDWCRTAVSADKILKRAIDFYDKGIPVRWILVDDGWFQRKGKLLWNFEPDKEKFPDGIKPVVDKLKNDCGVKWVGFWQCFSGDWNGIHPESPIVKNYPQLVYKTNGGEYLPQITEGGSFSFWNKWDSYLKNEGVDFVKVDVETNLEACTHGNIAVGRAARGAYNGMDAATAMLFNGNVINCTGMAQECLWNKPLGLMNRNSEDFIQGDIMSMRSFAMASVYNSLFNSEFSYVDGDMMQTHDITAKINIVLHALSGGCVYLSDHIGKTVEEYACAFADSTGKLYRCDKIGLPTIDRLFVDAKKESVLLKFHNMKNKTGYLGVVNVNCDGNTINDVISPKDVYELTGEEFVLYEYFTKKIEKVKYNDEISVTLGNCDTTMYQFTPIINGFSFIGNVDKYVSAAAVEKEVDFASRKILTLREGGNFVYYFNKEHELYINGEKTSPNNTGDIYSFSCDSNSEIIVEFVF